jgi:hypothetical protein
VTVRQLTDDGRSHTQRDLLFTFDGAVA